MKGRPADPKRARRGTGHRRGAGELRELPVPADRVDLQGPPEPPADLEDGAAAIWRAVIADVDTRLWRAGDLELLRMYAVHCWRHRRATAEIERYGEVVKGARGPMLNPLTRLERDEAATVIRLAEQLGLTLAARMRTGLMLAQGATLVEQLERRIGQRD